MYSGCFSDLEKKNPARCLVMAVWRHQILKKKPKRPLLYAAGFHTRPDHSAEYIADGRRALKAVKALPSQYFIKKLKSPQETGRRL